jgi:nitrite reductase (NO-forming)
MPPSTSSARRRPKDSVQRRVCVGLALTLGALSGVAFAVQDRRDGPPSLTPATAAAAASHRAFTGHHHADISRSGSAVSGRTAEEGGIRYEAYRRPDPTLPAVQRGAVKRFRIDVLEHRTKVSATQPPLRVWSFGVNGRFMRGTGVSAPIVVNQGDKVQLTFVNGADAAMGVDAPHSLDVHAAEVAPAPDFKTIAPGSTWHYSFVARTPGVFMYHCATAPMLLHLGAGMVGMFVVKPHNLARVDRELWLVEQEYYLGHRPGQDPDYNKMMNERPDVIAFNGYADQYVDHPIAVKRGEKIRIYLLNPGPSHVASFHIIGAVFDKTRSEGVTGGPAQVLALAPSTGGTVDFTLKQNGSYTFLDHNFAMMEKGAMGVLATEGAARRG